MSIGENELRAILEGLEGVTPGPWTSDRHFSVGPRSQFDDQSFNMMLPMADVFGDNQAADTDHIARLDPDTVRSIVTELLARRSSSDGLGTVKALEAIERIIRTNIVGTDEPNRMMIDGEWHTGPVVDMAVKLLKGLQQIAADGLTSIGVEALPQDVIALVIAGREMLDQGHAHDNAEANALDRALEAFSSRVPFENQPDAVGVEAGK